MDKKYEGVYTSPIDFALGTMSMQTKSNAFRNDALTTEDVNGWTIDTVCPPDTGEWETGISRNGGSWIITEQYKNYEEAKTGHMKWVNECKDNPEQKFKDITFEIMFGSGSDIADMMDDYDG